MRLDDKVQYDDWHYQSKKDEVIGPLTNQEMSDAFKAGSITPQTLVWKYGWDNWIPWSASELKSTVIRQPPPMPVQNGWLFTMATFPIWGWLFIELPLVYGIVSKSPDLYSISELMDSNGWLIAFGLIYSIGSLLMALWDYNALHKRRIKVKVGPILAFFFPPLYFLLRGIAAQKQSMSSTKSFAAIAIWILSIMARIGLELAIY